MFQPSGSFVDFPIKMETNQDQPTDVMMSHQHDLKNKKKKEYNCTQCNKVFDAPSTLKIHTRFHTGEKPYQCDYCGKGFITPSDVIKHQRTHRATKPFKCGHCNKEFSNQSRHIIMMASTGVKRKRSSYDAAFKLKVIEFAEVNGNRAAEREFSVSEKVVRDWRKMKETLSEMPKTKRARRGKQAHYREMERELAGWITDQRNNGYIVSLLQIRLQAKKLNSDASFKASNGWTHRFMQRHNLSLKVN